jgi:hypothetical protein
MTNIQECITFRGKAGGGGNDNKNKKVQKTFKKT